MLPCTPSTPITLNCRLFAILLAPAAVMLVRPHSKISTLCLSVPKSTSLTFLHRVTLSLRNRPALLKISTSTSPTPDQETSRTSNRASAPESADQPLRPLAQDAWISRRSRRSRTPTGMSSRRTWGPRALRMRRDAGRWEMTAGERPPQRETSREARRVRDGRKDAAVASVRCVWARLRKMRDDRELSAVNVRGPTPVHQARSRAVRAVREAKRGAERSVTRPALRWRESC